MATDLRKLQKAATAALEDIKAREVEIFDVAHLTTMFDRVIIASADSAGCMMWTTISPRSMSTQSPPSSPSTP